MLSYFKFLVRTFKDSFLQPLEKEFIAYTQAHTKTWEIDSGAQILCQMPKDYGFLIKFTHTAPWLAKKHRAHIHLISLWTSSEMTGVSWRSNFIWKLINNPFAERKWQKLYGSFGARNGLSNRRPHLSAHAKQQAKMQFDSLRSKEDVLTLKIAEINIGDLVYDTYLRFRPAPTIDIQDPFLLAILLSAWEVYENFTDYLSTYSVRALLTSYASYIHHGLPARICLAHNIPVWSMGVDGHLLKQITPDFPSHARAHFRYANLFSSLPEQEPKRADARATLEARFQGGIDKATLYMRTSAFADNTQRHAFDESDLRPRALVLLHCFFDSPHIYRDMLFPDFYDWLDFTLATATQSNARFYVKPHPNGLPANAAIVANFKKRYPQITFLDATTSNRAIIAQGVEAIFTVYGTCAHEFPWFGIPAACAGDNPHVNYSFTQTAKSREEYASWILNPSSLRKPNTVQDKQQIEEFVYMHGIYTGDGRTQASNIFQCPLASDDPEMLAWYIQNGSARDPTALLLDEAARNTIIHRL